MTRSSRSRWIIGGAFALLLGGAVDARAQESATITGRVTAPGGRPLEAANVYITELNVSVGTNAEGMYRITIAPARVRSQAVTLRARAIGFKPQGRPITLTPGAQTVDFTLENDVSRLSEVVITGVAGATELHKVPFAVSQVNAADLPVPATNPLSALQGKVPGVNIVSSSGRPGANPSILLRAPTSINASGRGQDPLIIIDGIITNGNLADISSLDIENIEIVRGAAAASLYGARAGNGVIQITTKSGKNVAEGVRFSVRTEYGVSDIERDISIAQRHPYLMTPDGSRFCAAADCSVTFDYQEEISKINNSASAVPPQPTVAPINQTSSVWSTFQNGRWPGRTYNQIDAIVDPGPFSQTNLDVAGRMGSGNFFTSYSNVRQQGSFIGLNGYTSHRFRMNLDYNFGQQWTMALRSFYARSTADGQDAEGNVFFDLTRMPAGVNLLEKDPIHHQYIIRPDLQGENENPAYDLSYRDRENTTDRVLAAGTLTYRPFDFMDIEGNLSFDRSNTMQRRFADKGFRTARNNTGLNNGNILNGEAGDQSLNTSIQTTLRHDLSTDLHTRLQLRALYERQDADTFNFIGPNLAVAGVRSAENPLIATLDINNAETSIRQLSYFAIGNVEFKERYVLDALVRRDGSSLFGAENRWATFGRGSAAWRISEEPWFHLPALTDAKLRYSIGQAGRSPRFSAQYETYTLGGGFIDRQNLGNRQLRPEIVTEQEYGTDLEFFDRIGLNVTGSRAVAKDQILLVPLSAVTGYARQWQNAGQVDTKAFELALNVPVFTAHNASWTTRFMYDLSRSTITKLTVPPFQYGVSSQGLEGAFYAREGERLGTIYGTRFATSCGDLPASMQSLCATEFAVNSDGYLVWVGAGNTPASGFEHDCAGGGTNWGCAGPVLPPLAGRAGRLMWGTPFAAEAIDPMTGQPTTYVALGNTLPKYRLGWSNQFNFRRFSGYLLVDASIGQKIYNQGRHWAYFENYSGDQDQPTATTAADSARLKPIGYYGSTGLYNVLQPNSHFIENGSFAKIRELSVSYRAGRLPGLGGDWNFSLIGRNLHTFTHYKGFDPDVGIGGGDSGSGVINAFDAYRFPNLRTVTFSVGSTF